MKRLSLLCALIMGFLCCLCGIRVSAQESGFSFQLDREEGLPGSGVKLSLNYDGRYGELGAFGLRIEYDPVAVECERVSSSKSMEENYLYTTGYGPWVSTVYTMRTRQTSVKNAGTLLTFHFRLLEDIPPANISFTAEIYQVTSGAPGMLLESFKQTLRFSVLAKPSSDARLLNLKPEAGELIPSFSSDITRYTLAVPFEVKTMSFLAEAAAEASYRVNRKNLGAGGSYTDFIITVTAADGETKTAYTVTVYRGEKEEPVPTEKPIPPPEGGITEKPVATPRPATTQKPRASPRSTTSPRPTHPETGTEKPKELIEAAEKEESSGGEFIGAAGSMPVQTEDSSFFWAVAAFGVFAAGLSCVKPVAAWICSFWGEREERPKKRKGLWRKKKPQENGKKGEGADEVKLGHVFGREKEENDPEDLF